MKIDGARLLVENHSCEEISTPVCYSLVLDVLVIDYCGLPTGNK
jgi:hypothetical protein